MSMAMIVNLQRLFQNWFFFLQPLVPSMLGTIAMVLNANDEVSAQEALELFIEVAEAHPRFLRKQLGEVLTAMLQV